MKGGKRLTEKEREFIYDALEISDPFKEVMIAKTMLERDDEPEYCTCNTGTVATRGDLCLDCGKPVKGE